MGTYIYHKTKDQLAHNIQVARGDAQGTLLLRNANVVNVFSGEIYQTNILIDGDTVVGLSELYEEAGEIIELAGRYVIPGLIDSHVHLESSMVSPAEFTKAVLPHGTTTVVWDPHEIANVLGLTGLEYVLKSTAELPINIYIMASSCVPATHLETAGADLSAHDLSRFLNHPRVLGLAEMMNYPGVIFTMDEVIEKIAQWRSRFILDGHAPGLTGHDLNAYLAAGITSDHECTTKTEAMEKLRSGMHIMIREGSAAKNLSELITIIRDVYRERVSFATDDRHPLDLIKEGHVDNIMQKAVSMGLSPIRAIQLATINAAQYFRLDGHGAIAPGYRADIVVLSDLRSFQVDQVIKDGHPVVQFGKLCIDISEYKDAAVLNTVRIAPLGEHPFAIAAEDKPAKIIQLIPHQIVTKKVMMNPKVKNGHVVVDTDQDILKLAVVERHRASGNIGIGLVNGFGLKAGALASSVGHDSHNIIVVGANDADMKLAVERIAELQGGCVAVADGTVLAEMPLTIAGLMSAEPIAVVIDQQEKLHQAAADLGCQLSDPFMTLAFLSLPPIPALKVTDRGLVDAEKFEIVSLFGE